MNLFEPARILLERCTHTDFFHSIGQSIDDTSIDRVWDWRAALKMLASVESRDYFVGASNEISGECFIRNQSEFNKWNEIVHEANRVLTPVVLPKVRAGLPVTGKRLDLLANEVILQMRLAVVEWQLRPWHDSDFFLRVFEWLERGHLPCGGSGEFALGKLVIF